MKHALIIGASGSIGAAIAHALDTSGWSVTTLSRQKDGLDFRDPETVTACLDALDGPFDLILVTTGALDGPEGGPEKALGQITAAHMADQFQINTIGPALVLSQAPRLLAKDSRAVVAALTARVGSIGDNRLGGWYSYRASKAALNQIIHTAAIELRRTHPKAIAVALHPGTVKSALTAKYLGRHPAVEPEEAADNLIGVIEGLGAEDSGQFFDWAGKPVVW